MYGTINIRRNLLSRTKNAVRDLDNLNYRKMKKILMTEMMETESTLGQVNYMIARI